MIDWRYWLIGILLGIVSGLISFVCEEFRRYDICIDGNVFTNVQCTFHMFHPEIEVFDPEINQTVHFRYSWYYISKSYWKRKNNEKEDV